MFADDIKICRVVYIISDSLLLQQDLDKLSEWTWKWLLRFSVPKCVVLPLSNSRSTNHTETDASDVDKSQLLKVKFEKIFLYKWSCAVMEQTSRWGGSSINNQCIQRSPKQLLPWNRMWTLWKAYGLTNALCIIVHNLMMCTTSNCNMSINQATTSIIMFTKLNVCQFVFTFQFTKLNVHQIKYLPNIPCIQ